MYTIEIVYENDIGEYYKVINWEVEDKYFYMKFENEHIVILPTNKIIIIDIIKNN